MTPICDGRCAWGRRSVGGGPGLLEKILREDRHVYEAEKEKEVTIDPSPERNDPATCQHYATDTDGWCAGCSTQIRETA